MTNYRHIDRTTATLADDLGIAPWANQIYQDGDIVGAIESLHIVLSNIQTVIDNLAGEAREQGITWERLGDATGITRQRARQKWGNQHIIRSSDRT